MSLKHALLGFINYGPMTGYELKKFFDTSVAHFWNAELSQIYPALKAMESEGLVEMKVEVQDDRPNRKVYSITESGRRELVDWLAKPADRDQVREPILIKVFFGSSLSKQASGNLRSTAGSRYTLPSSNGPTTLSVRLRPPMAPSLNTGTPRTAKLRCAP